MEIFHYLDHGENPERFVKDSLEQCFTKNQQTHAKVFALDALRDQLADDFRKQFPEQYQAFLEQSGPQNPIKPPPPPTPQASASASSQSTQQLQQGVKMEESSDDESIEVVQVPSTGAKGPVAPAAAPAAASVADDEEEVSYIKRSRSTTMVDVVPDDDSMQ